MQTTRAVITQEAAATNHLAGESSPYLLQHARNPVNWYPWGDEALAKAKREDKPIFLSIGYMACHWCHVMENESFENQAIAALLNQHFVSIKVDREERPDLDRIYMEAVQTLTGSGGWPMSVFLTPELQPFYGGTYFPPEDRYGRIGFKTLITELARIWEKDRERVQENAAQITDVLRRPPPPARNEPLDPKLLQETEEALARAFDPINGGFARAPKFPAPGALEFLLRRHRLTGSQTPLDMAVKTLAAMAEGGIYDQLGGGFHRYSVDEKWRVPHFEKTLYDNARLASVYTSAYLVTGEPLFKRIAVETIDFVLRELADESGGFHSTLDADSEGGEGKYYVWSEAEIDRALPGDLAGPLKLHFGVTAEGNVEGKNVLYVARARPELAARKPAFPKTPVAAVDKGRQVLLQIREKRVRPAKDDKQLTNWNALMIQTLAEAGAAFDNPRYVTAARRAAEWILDTMIENDTLFHTFRNGKAGVPAFLDDYAYTARALLSLYEATQELAYLERADRLTHQMIARFHDPDAGGFFYTRADAQHLIVRRKALTDEALPAGNAVAAEVLFRLAGYEENDQYAELGARAVQAALNRARRYRPAFMATWLALDFHLAPPLELTVTGPPGDPATKALLKEAKRRYAPHLLLTHWDADGPGAKHALELIPWLYGRTMLDGKPTAYLCRNRTCEPPVNTLGELATLLDGR